MQVAPAHRKAVSDSPTIGGFLGLRIGNKDFFFSPEIGVFFDHSALGVRKNNMIFVPGVTFQKKGFGLGFR